MAKSLGYKALAFVSLVALPVGAGVGTGPKDDFVIAVQDSTLKILAADLLANDSPGIMDPSRIRLTSSPVNGTLQRTSDGYLYRARAGYFGPDTFTYALTDPGSPQATVKIQVSPDYLAIHGDFDADGTGEWGWFDSAAVRFHVCDPGPTPRCEILWTGPAQLAGRTPVVGDWNADGRDDVGVFDARTGWFHLATLGVIAGPRSFPLGVGGGLETPIVGDWNADGMDTVGLRRPAEGRFLLRNQNGAGLFDYDFVFGRERPNAGAVAFNPGQGRGASVGLHVGSELLLYSPSTRSQTQTPVQCPSEPKRQPLVYLRHFGLVVYDPAANLYTNCGGITVPLNGYLPPT